jgi:hypothetical protein
MTYYQVFAQVHPGQYNRALVHTNIFPVHAKALPARSLVSIGNFHTLRRYFPKAEQAQMWAEHLHTTHAKGPVKNPILDSCQINLFEEFTK